MISEQYIKTAFVSDTLVRSAKKIRQGQEIVVADWNLFDSGETATYTKGHFTATRTETGATLVMRYVKKFRFLDIADPRRLQSQPRKEGYHLYNRLTFGTVYNYTYPTIKYGFVKDVREQWLTKTAEALGIPKSELSNVLSKQARHKTLNLG